MRSHRDRGTHTNIPLLVMDYYQRPFIILHKEIDRVYTQQDFTRPHSIRSRFWQLIPYGEYLPEKGRLYLKSYLNSVENELARQIGNLSLAYCLHLYRRLSPGPIGQQQQPETIVITRAVLEAAIQEYARCPLPQ